jgi:vacuolar-type H+-ATPase subunit I/STV1
MPVSTPRGIVRAFERMVFLAHPSYGTIDPTPFVAVMFIILWIMFGDVGQVYRLSSARINSEGEVVRGLSQKVILGTPSWRGFTGGRFLYGSFFGKRRYTQRSVTRLLTGHYRTISSL